MSDFSKAYCNLHPHELITNFCTKPECLVPLCANCICTHTQQHIQEQTAPLYENIRSTYKNMHEQIRIKIEDLEKLKGRISKVEKKTFDKRNILKQVIMKAREDCHQYIDEYFDQRCENLLKEIQGTERKSGLQCQSRLQSLCNSITRQVSGLVSASQQASFDGFIESMPRLRGVVLENASKLVYQLEKEITNNENFHTTIEYKRQQINSLSKVLNSVVKMCVNLPNYHQIQDYQNLQKNSKVPENKTQNANIQPTNNPVRVPTRGYSADQMRNGRPNSPAHNFSKKNEKNIQSQLNIFPQTIKSPLNTQIPQKQNNFINGNIAHRGYLNQIPIHKNFNVQANNRNQNSLINYQAKGNDQLARSSPLQNLKNPHTLAVSRAENSFMSENQVIAQKNPQKMSLIQGQKNQFSKVSLSKKPKKNGLRIINQQMAESDNQSSNLKASKVQGLYY